MDVLFLELKNSIINFDEIAGLSAIDSIKKNLRFTRDFFLIDKERRYLSSMLYDALSFTSWKSFSIEMIDELELAVYGFYETSLSREYIKEVRNKLEKLNFEFFPQ